MDRIRNRISRLGGSQQRATGLSDANEENAISQTNQMQGMLGRERKSLNYLETLGRRRLTARKAKSCETTIAQRPENAGKQRQDEQHHRELLNQIHAVVEGLASPIRSMRTHSLPSIIIGSATPNQTPPALRFTSAPGG